MKSAARGTDLPGNIITTLRPNSSLASPEADFSEMKNASSSTCPREKQKDPENSRSASDDKDEASTGEVFDPEIPDGDNLWDSQPRSGRRSSSISKVSLDDDDLDIW